MNRAIQIVKDKSGSGAPLILAVVLATILISTVVFEYMRLLIVAQGVRDSVQSAIIDVATENWDEAYPALREGYAGGYKLSDSTWYQNITTGNVYGRLKSVLGLKRENRKYVKYSGENVEYTLSGLSLTIANAPFAPSDTNEVTQLNVTGTITVEVPLSFGWENGTPMKMTLKLKATYTPKF